MFASVFSITPIRSSPRSQIPLTTSVPTQRCSFVQVPVNLEDGLTPGLCGDLLWLQHNCAPWFWRRRFLPPSQPRAPESANPPRNFASEFGRESTARRTMCRPSFKPAMVFSVATRVVWRGLMAALRFSTTPPTLNSSAKIAQLWAKAWMAAVDRHQGRFAPLAEGKFHRQHDGR